MTTYRIERRHRVEVCTDPQQRCYNGVYFSSELVWVEWEVLDLGVPAEAVGGRLAFWRELNDYAVSQRGENARAEFRAVAEPSSEMQGLQKLGIDESVAPRYLTDEVIARICHEVNRLYCISIGDDSHRPWKRAPDWQKESAIAGVRFHRDNPDAGPSESHNNWYARKVADGWSYGPEKDPAKREHPCMVPFGELSVEQQFKDYLFNGVVNAALGR